MGKNKIADNYGLKQDEKDGIVTVAFEKKKKANTKSQESVSIESKQFLVE